VRRAILGSHARRQWPGPRPDEPQPSKKSVQRLIGEIREATDRKTAWQEAEAKVKEINRKLAGWANYFSLGPVSKAYRAVNSYTAPRLRRWLCHKHKVTSTGTTRFPNEYLYDTIGLIKLSPGARNPSSEDLKSCPRAVCKLPTWP
jgi:RNA-directed DNA polymerase